MRRRDREITDSAEILEVIHEASVCRLAMWDGVEPYLVPVNFGYADNAIYIHCAPSGRKLDILTSHPDVCFQLDTDVTVVPADRACDWTLKYRSVVGWGTARIVDDSEEIRKGLKILMRHYTKKAALFSDADVAGVRMIRIDISRMTGKKSM